MSFSSGDGGTTCISDCSCSLRLNNVILCNVCWSTNNKSKHVRISRAHKNYDRWQCAAGLVEVKRTESRMGVGRFVLTEWCLRPPYIDNIAI